MKDFIHGALVKAASTDGIENMLKGAGIGAGANVGIGAVQGDFDVVGNAFSGAALGGMGGAAMKYGANRYAGNLLKQADGITEAGGKKVGMFTNPGENHALSFMGGDDNTERFAKMAAAGAFDGKGFSSGTAAQGSGPKAIADVAQTPGETSKAGGTKTNAEYFKDKKGYSVDGDDVYKETSVQREMTIPNFQMPNSSGELQGASNLSVTGNLSNKIGETQQNIIRNAEKARITGVNTGTQNLEQKPTVGADRNLKRVSDIIGKNKGVGVTDQSGPRPLSANQMREALKNFSSLDEGGREGMRRSMTPEQFAFVSSRQGRNAS